MSFGERQLGRGFAWPNIELSEGSNQVKVSAGLPGLDEKDVDIHLADGVLTISGEKRTEAEDKDRLFSERYYGRVERRIPVDDIDPDKVKASFKNGVLTVTLPRLPAARRRAAPRSSRNTPYPALGRRRRRRHSPWRKRSG